MFGRDGKKQAQTAHDSLLKLVETLAVRVAAVEGQVGALATEWADTRDQLRRSYQRLEKAAQRAEAASEPSPPTAPAPPGDQGAHGFARKLQQIRRG